MEMLWWLFRHTAAYPGQLQQLIATQRIAFFFRKRIQIVSITSGISHHPVTGMQHGGIKIEGITALGGSRIKREQQCCRFFTDPLYSFD